MHKAPSYFEQMIRGMLQNKRPSANTTMRLKVPATPYKLKEEVHSEGNHFIYTGILTDFLGQKFHSFKLKRTKNNYVIEPFESDLESYITTTNIDELQLTKNLVEWYEEKPRTQLQLDLGHFFRLVVSQKKVTEGPSAPTTDQDDQEIVQLLLDIPELQKILHKTLAIEGWADEHITQIERLIIEDTLN